MRSRPSALFAGIRAAVSATILAFPSASKAQELHWDPNGTAVGFGGFSGAWNGVNSFWNSDSAGGGGMLTATTSSTSELFVPGTGPTGVIDLTTSQSAASLTLNNTGGLAALQLSNGASLNLTGSLTDTGAGSADIRINNTSEANAATKLTASSVSIGVVGVTSATGGVAQFFTTGYDMTIFTQYGIGSPGGDTTVRQTAGTVTVNSAGDRGFVFAPSSDNFTNSSLYTTRYVLDGGTMRANRIGTANFDGTNDVTNRWATDSRVEFNHGTIANFSTGTLLLQNGAAFKNYDGTTGTKDMGFDTSKPVSIELAQTGTHTIDAAGTSGKVIVTPSAQLINKSGEAGTLTKTGTGSLIFTGGGPVAVNSHSGSTTVTAGTVSTDYSIVAGQAATGGTDNLSNGYSAASQLVLDGGNFELKGRSSAAATSANGVTLPAGNTIGSIGAYSVNVGSTAGLVVGQSVSNAFLPSGTYIRQIQSSTVIQLSHLSTSMTSQAGQTLNFGAATFASTQTIDNVDLQQTATLTVTPGAGSSTTRLNAGNVSGSGGFTKAGTGTLSLTGNLTYTGDTAVNAGTLLIEGNGSAATGTISVAAGATLALGPSAVLGGPVSSNGRILPGTYQTNLTLGSTSRVPFKVNSTADHHKLANDGGDTLAFENHTTLELDFTGYTPTVGDTFMLFPNWAARTGNASAVLVMTTGLDPLYALDTTNLLVNGSVSLRTVAGSPITTQPDGTMVRVSNGEQFYPVGFNFIRLNNLESGHHSTFHVSDYDGPAATAMFQRLALAGYTAVRVFVNSTTSSPSGAGWQTNPITPLNPTYLDHFADFLKRAAAEGILVQPSVPSFPYNNFYQPLVGAAPPMVTGSNSYYLHPGFITAREAWLTDFWTGIRARYPDCAEALLCVDLENELHYSVTEQPFSLASGTFNAANGQSYDLATQKQDLADDMAVYWVNRMCAVVRSVLPTTLINTNVFSYHAVGRTGPGDFRVFGADWRNRVPFRPRALAASDTDIVGLHFYWRSLAESSADFASVEFTTLKAEAIAAGKVLTVGEFGSLHAHIPANDPAAALALLPTMADFLIQQGFQGWLLWTFDSIEQANHHLASDANFAIFHHLAQKIPGASGPELADNFAGSSFSPGWFQTSPANWSVTNGAATLATISGFQQIYQPQNNGLFTDFRATTRFQFTASGTGRGGIGFRKQQPDVATGYSAFMTASGEVKLEVHDPSTGTSITLGSIQTAIDPFAGFVDLTIEAAGTRIRVWANGTLCIDVTDSRWSSGYPGFFFDEIAGKIDLVAVNDISQLPDGATDEDGDGWTRSQEFIWGTSDTNAASFFRPATTFEPGTGFTLRWDGLAQRRYTLWRSPTLADGSWVRIFDTGVLAAATPLEVADPASLTQPRAFYKIEGVYHGP